MASKDLEKLVVRLEAEVAQYKKKLDSANKKSKSWKKETVKDIDDVAKKFGAIALAAGAAFTAMYAKSAQSLDRLAKTADKLGETPAKLQALQFQAELTGVSVETTNMALQRMTRRVSEAAAGTGEAVNALKELNLDAAALAQLSPADQFADIAEAMQGVTNQGDRVRLSMKLFDSEGVSLVNTLAQGKTGLNEASKELESFGALLSRTDLSKIEAANDMFTRIKAVSAATANQIAVQVAPIVEALANEFLNVSREAGGLGEVVGDSLDFVSQAVGVVANAVRGLEVIWAGAKVLVAEFFLDIVSGAAQADRALTNLLNLVGIDAKPNQFLQGLSDSLRMTYEETKQDLDEILMAPIPSEKIEKFVANVYSKAENELNKKPKLSLIDGTMTGDSASSFGSSSGSTRDQDTPTTFSFISDPEKLKTYSDLLEEYKIVSENAALYIEDSFVTSFSSIADTMSNTLADAIIEGESLGAALGDVAKTLAKDMLSGLIKIGAQMAINALFAQKTQATLTATGAAMAATLSAAWAAPAALVSLATLGGNAAPASAGLASTVALSNTLALSGIAHDGISQVPVEGTWLLDKGERVLSAQQNSDLTQYLREKGTGASANEESNPKVVEIHSYGLHSSNDIRRLGERLNEELPDRIKVKVFSK